MHITSVTVRLTYMSRWSQENVRESDSREKGVCSKHLQNGAVGRYLYLLNGRVVGLADVCHVHIVQSVHDSLLLRRGDDDRENDNICSLSVRVIT